MSKFLIKKNFLLLWVAVVWVFLISLTNAFLFAQKEEEVQEIRGDIKIILKHYEQLKTNTK